MAYGNLEQAFCKKLERNVGLWVEEGGYVCPLVAVCGIKRRSLVEVVENIVKSCQPESTRSEGSGRVLSE